MFRGVFNSYKKKKSFIEMILKDLNHIFLYIRQFINNGFKTKTLLVYPDYPGSGTTIYKVGKLLNYNITNKLCNNPKAIIFWEDKTFKDQFHSLEKYNQKQTVVNYHSRDISKTYVDSIFTQVFGYSTSINPLTYTGKIVAKSDINAAHDGKILDAPIATTQKNTVYQLLIDNSFDETSVLDIRIPIVSTTLDFVYLKYRQKNERFKNTTITTKIDAIAHIFSKEEIKQINDFVKKISLDYGELDILRDNQTNKIYIVDVNDTPHGPPANTSKSDKKIALNKIAEAFKKLA